MILSVLIPTLEERKGVFDSLHERLLMLSEPYRDEVEILYERDDREITTGEKRNKLVNRAKGKFSVFIDDDDDVPNYYFHDIISTIKDDPRIDCIGFNGLLICNGIESVFRHSIELPFSKHQVKGVYLRPPNHINPMLTKYFREIKFPAQTFAEDYDFCIRLAEKHLIKRQPFIDKVMYLYHFKPNK